MQFISQQAFWPTFSLLLALFSRSVVAQDGPPAASSATSVLSSATTSPPSAASTTSATSTNHDPVTHTISVGFAGFTFQPNVVLAHVGDIVEFDFYPANHSVVRAEYGVPCVPREDVGVDYQGFFSGFQPVDAILPDPPKWSVRVNHTRPVFFYCSAPGSCIDYGMVGGINPNSSQTVAQQQQLARAATFMLQPGEPWPSEEPDPYTTTVGSSIPSTSATTPAAPAAATTSSSAATNDHHSLSGGAIAGIVVGGVVALVLIGGVFYLCGRNRALSDILKGRSSHDPNQHQAGNRQSAMSGTTIFSNPPKHMSNMTMVPPQHPGSPTPQYAAHGERSPSLRGGFPDTFTPISQPYDMARSPSPGQVPAYTPIPQELPQNSPPGLHEMYVPPETSQWQRDDRRKYGGGGGGGGGGDRFEI